MEPPRHLGSKAEAKTLLDAIYAQRAGISLASAAAAGGAGGGGGAVINTRSLRLPGVTCSTASHTEVTERSRPREREETRGARRGDGEQIQEDVLKLWNVAKSQIEALYDGVRPLSSQASRVAHSLQRLSRSPFFLAVPSSTNFERRLSADTVPPLHLKRRVGTN
ncbi:hypothetical protein C8Q76DRAFT_694550 [Earliella scabrosa]|nr:hypothetical protein C8Q76DRAFT_694550 [Earliella scabrosa]